MFGPKQRIYGLKKLIASAHVFLLCCIPHITCILAADMAYIKNKLIVKMVVRLWQ